MIENKLTKLFRRSPQLIINFPSFISKLGWNIYEARLRKLKKTTITLKTLLTRIVIGSNEI